MEGLLETAEQKITPLCSHFGTCGGCAFQDLDYPVQLELKRKMVKEALCHPERSEGSASRDSSASPQNDNFVVHPPLPSPKPFHYRHMVAMTVKRRQNALRLGFTGSDRRTFIPIESCPIADERIDRFLPEALSKLEAMPPERKFHTSQIVLRVGDNGEVVTSLRTDRGRKLECKVSGKSFSYSISSFFQSNFSILESFVQVIRVILSGAHIFGEERQVLPKKYSRKKRAAKNPVRDPSPAKDLWRAQDDGSCSRGTLFDLYSGVGLFGILLSDSYQEVIGIEEGYEAVQLAIANATQNKINNILFLEGKVETLLPELVSKAGARHASPLHVIIDPPRVGLKPEVVQCLLELPIDKLIYVSCELTALRRDLELLQERFKITQVQPLDLFPQTKHIETIVLLEPC